MAIPLQLTIKDINGDNAAIENKIRQKTKKLGKFCDKIMKCHVRIEVPKNHMNKGKLYTVRIDIKVPRRKEIVIKRVMDKDLYVAIREAFNAAARQLDAHEEMKRGDVKSHQPYLKGKITKLFPEAQYGFISTFEGSEYYFAFDNVLHPASELLEVGAPVEFLETPAGDGLQAVKIIAIVKSQHVL